MGKDFCTVAASAEPDAVACFVTDRLHLFSVLALARIEGGIDVDQLDRSRLHLLQHVQVISKHNPIHSEFSAPNTNVPLDSAASTCIVFFGPVERSRNVCE